MDNYQKESRLRSALKGFTWRILATATIILLAYFKTGDLSFAMELGALEFVIKYLLYYIHERVWQVVPRGSIREWSKRRENNEE